MASYKATSAGAVVPQGRQVRPLRAIHNVKPGENLNDIARMYGTDVGTLKKMNGHTIGRNGVVHAGMRLEI